MIDAVDLDLVAGVLAEEDPIALLDRQRPQFPFVVHLAVADGDPLRLRRFLLGRVGNDDPALGLLFFSDTTDDHAVLQRANFHSGSSRTEMVWHSNSLSASAGIYPQTLPSQWVAGESWHPGSEAANETRSRQLKSFRFF